MYPVLALALSTWANAAECTASDAVRLFATAADHRDVAALEAVLHPEFRVVFTMKGSNEASLMPRAVWFSMLAEGKIGGVPRTLDIRSATTERGLGTVVATLRGASGHFESTFTVMRDTTGCRIVEDALVYTPPAAK